MPADHSVSPADTPDYEAIRLRAQSQLSHFAISSGDTSAMLTCDRCGKPLNRWHDEPCDYLPDAAHLLAEDVLALLAVGERDKAEIERLTEEHDVLAMDQEEGREVRGDWAALARQIAPDTSDENCRCDVCAIGRGLDAGVRDKERIAQLTEAIQRALADLGPPMPGDPKDNAESILAAVLADKEDADNG